MEKPSVVSSMKDQKTNVTYHVFAYRTLTMGELVQAVRFQQSQQRKKPKKGSSIEIHTIIGHND
ncbi:MAG: hypothetical protein ABIQ70_07050 [Dokdonella sp.]